MILTSSLFASNLLAWWDEHGRHDIPWKEVSATGQPDPYGIWIAEVMLQQTTVAAVRDYFLRFTTRWPSVQALASAPDDQVMGEWAGLGYYARARNLLKCARVVTDEYDGTFPNTYDALLKLPGIGPYTAAAISAIAFDRPETVLDGNVERVMSRKLGKLFCRLFECLQKFFRNTVFGSEVRKVEGTKLFSRSRGYGIGGLCGIVEIDQISGGSPVVVTGHHNSAD